jgi:phage tail sheath protein FI
MIEIGVAPLYPAEFVIFRNEPGRQWIGASPFSADDDHRRD